MKRFVIIIGLVVVLATPLWAREDKAQPQRQGRAARRAQAADAGKNQADRQGGARNVERRDRSDSPLEMAQRLANQLNLTPEQRTQFNTLITQYRTQWQAQQQGSQSPSMRALLQELRTARRNGDEAKAAELRAQLKAAGGAGRDVMQSFFADVEKILTDEQVTKLDQLRRRFQNRPGVQDRMQQRAAFLDRLPAELEMTPEQQAAFEALREKGRTQLQAARAQQEELRPLRQELRQAREAGDDARVAELEAELKGKRPAGQAPGELLKELGDLLTPAQREKLQALVEENRAGLRAGGEGPALSLRQIASAAKQLNLDVAQREQLKQILREAQQARRPGADGGSPPAPGEGVQALRDKIMDMLDADQKAQFEQLLQARRPGPGGPAGPGARPKRPAPPSDSEEMEDSATGKPA